MSNEAKDSVCLLFLSLYRHFMGINTSMIIPCTKTKLIAAITYLKIQQPLGSVDLSGLNFIQFKTNLIAM